MAEQAIIGKGHVDVLDYLRLLAAGLVVAYHYLYFGPEVGAIHAHETFLAPAAKYGYLGVELFFLISGFVIMESARGKTASRFATARVRRLFPAFWTAVLLTAAGVALFGDRLGMSVTPKQVVANLTMLPSLIGQTLVDGVYWSLQYELEFYGLIFVLLFLGQAHRIAALLPWWAFGMLAVMLVVPSAQGLVYFGGYFAFFAAGALIAEVRHDGMTVLRGLGVLAASVVAVHAVRARGASLGDGRSLTIVTLIVVAWLLLLMVMWLPAVANLSLPHAVFIGNLTYPLYLLHAILGYIFMDFWIRDAPLWVVYATTIALMLAASAAVNLIVERRRFWTPLFRSTIGKAVRKVEPRQAVPAS